VTDEDEKKRRKELRVEVRRDRCHSRFVDLKGSTRRLRVKEKTGDVQNEGNERQRTFLGVTSSGKRSDQISDVTESKTR
jgi:hypothetical protein